MNGIYIWQNVYKSLPLWFLVVSGLAIGLVLGTIHRRIKDHREVRKV